MLSWKYHHRFYIFRWRGQVDQPRHYQIELLLTQESVDGTRRKHMLVAEIIVKHLKKYCQWKQPKGPSTEEWIKKVWYIYTMNITQPWKEWNNAVCSNMDGPRDYHTKWSKPEKDKHPMISLICWILKNDGNELILRKEKQSHRHRKQTQGY